MKNNEKIIDFLQQAINLLAEAKDDKETEFKQGWYYHDGIYTKLPIIGSRGFGFTAISKGFTDNVFVVSDPSIKALFKPVTDFTELTELLKAEVIKRIGKGKPIGVRDVEAHEVEHHSNAYYKEECKKLGNIFKYCSKTDTLYAIGYGITIVYENGVFATVANDMQAKLEEAKLKYPIGTEFKGIMTGRVFKVENGVKIGGQERENKLYCINLIEQAKKMGFKEGVKYTIKSKEGIKTHGSCGKEIKYIKNWVGGIDAIDGGGGTVIWRSDTGWATIIQEPIIIDGKEVEINYDYCKLDGMIYDKRIIVQLQSLNPIFPEILKRMEEKNNGSGNQ